MFNQSPVARYLMNHDHVLKPPLYPRGPALESFWVGDHVETGKVVCMERAWKFCALLPYLALRISSIRLFLLYFSIMNH